MVTWYQHSSHIAALRLVRAILGLGTIWWRPLVSGGRLANVSCGWFEDKQPGVKLRQWWSGCTACL